VYVGPVVTPGVQPGQERLRFFVTSEHTEDQLKTTADLVAEVVGLASQVGTLVTMPNAAAVIAEMTGAARPHDPPS
jgi:8-amino-7-oxononanoate synthase